MNYSLETIKRSGFGLLFLFQIQLTNKSPVIGPPPIFPSLCHLATLLCFPGLIISLNEINGGKSSLQMDLDVSECCASVVPTIDTAQRHKWLSPDYM